MRNHAVAVNPVDPVAGDVVEVGAVVTCFRVGDRVLAHAVGSEKSRNNPAEAAFQEYPVLLDRLARPIPDEMAYENAAAIPLALSTAASGMFQKDFLALRHPSANPTPTETTLLVWGGSTSVGSAAFQLAVAAGYRVVTTASPRNFDYASATVVDDIVRALDGSTIAGAVAIGTGSAEACLDIVNPCTGNKFVAVASTSVSFDTLDGEGRLALRLAGLLPRFVWSGAMLRVTARRRRIRTKFIWGSALTDDEVSLVIDQDFLPEALATGRYAAAPDPHVAGLGLEAVRAGFEVLRAGVSAAKVVVSL